MLYDRVLVVLSACVVVGVAFFGCGSSDDGWSPLPNPGLSTEQWQCLTSGGCGSDCRPCNVPLNPGQDECYPRFTFCNAHTMSCGVPTPDCRDGWCRIPAGSFVMGTWRGLPGLPWDYTEPHTVVLTRSFLIQQTEVTQQQWMDRMGVLRSPSPYAACGPDCPVSGVTAFAMMKYANSLSISGGLEPCYALEGCSEVDATGGNLRCQRATFAGPDCKGYRLPSEAEWEVAAGTGADTVFPSGYCNYNEEDRCLASDEPGQFGWFCGNANVTYEGCRLDKESQSCFGPHPVGKKLPNRFGLLDTIGNVTEVTGSLYHDTGLGLQVDPGFDLVVKDYDDADWARLPLFGKALTEKGGMFSCPAWAVATQGLNASVWKEANLKYGYSGFRLVRTLERLVMPEGQ